MRQRKRVGALGALALTASLFTAWVSTSPASAAVANLTVPCVNTYDPTTVVDFPVDVVTTVTDLADNPITSVQAGDQFKVTAQATVTLPLVFIEGVMAQTGGTMTEMPIPRVHIAIPPPAGATGSNLTIDYAPGIVPIVSSPGVPLPDGAPMPSPPRTEIYTADTNASVATFVLDPALPGSPEAIAGGGTVWGTNGQAAALEIDLNIFGSVAVGFDCTNPATPFLQVPVTALPVPTVAISDVSGQAVDNATRAGNVITFGGPNWASSSAITVELCDLLLTSCSAADLTSVSAAIDGGGNLSGAATVAAAATTGARALRVSTDQSESDSTDVLVLGTPTINAPANAGLGAPITITGTNWNPASPGTIVSLADLTGTPVAAPVPVTVSPTGSFSVTTSVVAGTEAIAAAEMALGYPAPPGPGSLFAFSPFQVSANSCTVPPGGSCSITQTVLLDVIPGTLSMSQSNGIVDLGEIQLNGRAQQVGGAINQITVIDATGSLNGWDLSATMTDLTTGDGAGNRTIPAGNMSWTPSCDPVDADSDGVVDGNGAEVVSGGAGALDPVTGSTLCTAAVGGGGGTFTGNAALELHVAANVATGNYQATMTFLLI